MKLASALLAGCFAAPALAQTSVLYHLEHSAWNQISKVQGGVVVGTFPLAGIGEEGALAVSGDIRTTSWVPPPTVPSGGFQYTLAGIPTGVTYAGPGFGTMNDGACDGTYNYGVAFGFVQQFDRNWQNPVPLFASSVVGVTFHVGIAYDPTDNSFWIAAPASYLVEHYAFNGTRIDGFIRPGVQSVALDPADGTVWIADQSAILTQHDRTGLLLSSVFDDHFFGIDPVGIEFNVPSPGAAAVLGLASISLARRRRD